MLRVVRRSGVKARTQATNQLHALVVTAPEQVKHRLRGLSTRAQIEVCARFRPGTAQTTAAYAKRALRLLARRYQNLDTEITQVDKQIRGLCARANPALLAAYGVGPDTAAALLTAAGDNPGRMNSEAAFAALCALSPVAASSGRIVRHRLNRGGNRQANNALWRVATNRIRHDPRTKEYVTRRQAEGKTRPEILRCLKRHIAREVYHLLTDPPPTPHGAQLRHRRQQARITLTHAADRLDTQPTVLSQLERGLSHNHHLATRYQQWLNLNPPMGSGLVVGGLTWKVRLIWDNSRKKAMVLAWIGEALPMSRVSRRIDRLEVVFDDESLVADGGLLAAGTLMDRLGLEELWDEMLRLGDRVGGANPGRKVLSLVAAMLVGGTHIDHADRLRAGATAGVLPYRVMAPSTLGTFLRSLGRDDMGLVDAALEETGDHPTQTIRHVVAQGVVLSELRDLRAAGPPIRMPLRSRGPILKPSATGCSVTA